SSIHKRLLFSRLAELLGESQLCDVVLVVKETRINAHRVILAASSNYFKALFIKDVAKTGLHRVELANVEASAVDALVKYCYSGDINISDTNVLSILPAARMLQLDQVEVGFFFSQERAYAVDTAKKFKLLSVIHSLRYLL
ncbi:BTB/POZ domain protein, partial [Cooperia oncophora]